MRATRPTRSARVYAGPHGGCRAMWDKVSYCRTSDMTPRYTAQRAIVAVLAIVGGCEEPDLSLEGLPQGAQVDSGGKADGRLQVVFATATSASTLAYPDPTAPEDT